MAKKVIKKTTITTTVTESNKTLIVFIGDRSGSMFSIIDDAIGGFNKFLKKQKSLEEDAAMTVALFDDRYELLHNNVDLKKVKKMTREIWDPRGMTALYDAIGKTIKDVESSIKNQKKSERPDKVLVAIATDGGENASKEYNHSSIKSLIKKKEKDDWQFVFLAADQDAFSVGTSFGVRGGNTFSYTNTSKGNAVMFDSLDMATTTFRGLSKTDANYVTASASLFSSGDVDNQVSNIDIADGNTSNSLTFEGNTIFTTNSNTTDAEDDEDSNS